MALETDYRILLPVNGARKRRGHAGDDPANLRHPRAEGEEVETRKSLNEERGKLLPCPCQRVPQFPVTR